MSFVEIAPVIAAVAAVSFGVFRAITRGAASPRGWWWAAGVSALFLVFSVVAAAREGATGFWTEYVRNSWGNQIWFDLLIAATSVPDRAAGSPGRDHSVALGARQPSPRAGSDSWLSSPRCSAAKARSPPDRQYRGALAP